MSKRNILVLILLITLNVSLFSQSCYDTNKHEALRILNTFKLNEIKYKELAKSKLLFFLNSDSSLKKQFLAGDSSKLKRLKLILSPRLYLDYDARHYAYGENISKYFVFDTNNIEIGDASFCFNDTLIFSIKSNFVDCNLYEKVDFLEERTITSTLSDYNFYIYLNKHNPTLLNNILLHDSTFSGNFNFEVNGLGYFFIKDSTIYKYYIGGPENSRLIADLSFYMNNIISKKYLPWIHYCSRMCPCGGSKWWRIWDWKIFLWKPGDIPDEYEEYQPLCPEK